VEAHYRAALTELRRLTSFGCARSYAPRRTLTDFKRPRNRISAVRMAARDRSRWLMTSISRSVPKAHDLPSWPRSARQNRRHAGVQKVICAPGRFSDRTGGCTTDGRHRDGHKKAQKAQDHSSFVHFVPLCGSHFCLPSCGSISRCKLGIERFEMGQPLLARVAYHLQAAILQLTKFPDQIWPPISTPHHADVDWVFHFFLKAEGCLAMESCGRPGSERATRLERADLLP
jgi:hypothetical protein